MTGDPASRRSPAPQPRGLSGAVGELSTKRAGAHRPLDEPQPSSGSSAPAALTRRGDSGYVPRSDQDQRCRCRRECCHFRGFVCWHDAAAAAGANPALGAAAYVLLAELDTVADFVARDRRPGIVKKGTVVPAAPADILVVEPGTRAIPARFLRSRVAAPRLFVCAVGTTWGRGLKVKRKWPRPSGALPTAAAHVSDNRRPLSRT
jgi:hypothetical protein